MGSVKSASKAPPRFCDSNADFEIEMGKKMDT